MTDMSIPIRAFAPPTEFDDQCCDLCCATPVVTELDGDRMCQSCADKWVRGEQPDDDLVPLSHPAMQQAIARYYEVARDAELLKLAKGHKSFVRAALGKGE